MVFLNTTRNTMQLKNTIGNTKRNTTPLNGIEVRQTGPAMAVFGVYEKLHDGNQ